MIRIRNKFTKEKRKYRTQIEMSKDFNCSTGAVANLVHGRVSVFCGQWVLNKYPETKSHLRG